MDRIMNCINDNLDNPDFNVEKLTDEVGISRAQLHRKMKEIAGVSTGEFNGITPTEYAETKRKQ